MSFAKPLIFDVPMLLPLLLAIQIGAGTPPKPDNEGLATLPRPESAPWLKTLRLAPDFEAVDFGDLDGDGRMDAVVRTSNDAVFMPWIEVATAPLPVSSNGKTGVIFGSAILDSPSGPADLLACVGPLGLVVLEWQKSADDFIVGNSIKGPWLGATAVRVADADGDGLTDLVGLSSTGMEVLILLRVPGGGFQFKQPIALSAPATDLLGVQWELDAELEVAVETAAGVEVLDGDGTLLFSRPRVGLGGSMARITGDAGLDGIVWLTGPDANGAALLESADHTGLIATKLFDGHVPSEVITGDLDGDGDLEVALSWLDRPTLDLFECTGKGKFAGWHDQLSGAVMPALHKGEGHTARGAFGDFDHDGRLDFAQPSTLEPALQLYRNLEHTPPSMFPGVVSMLGPDFCSGQFTHVGHFMPWYEFPGPASVTDFELTVWVQDDAHSTLKPVAMENKTFPRPPDGQGGYFTDVQAEALLSPERIGWQYDPRIFSLTLQALDATGAQVGPTMTGILSPWPADLPIWLKADEWTGSLDVSMLMICEVGGPGPATGAWIRSKRMPPFPPRKRPLKKAP